MSKWYGSVSNRIEEGRNFLGRNEIKVGDDITMYLWSDRHCYHVVDVISQKEIKVKEYHVCADFSKPGGMGHQNWLYFKTLREMNKYLNSCNLKRSDGTIVHYNEDIEEPEPKTWVFRYNKWVEKRIFSNYYDKHPLVNFTEKQREVLLKGGSVAKYYDLSGKISFGVRDYYYDWEF